MANPAAKTPSSVPASPAAASSAAPTAAKKKFNVVLYVIVPVLVLAAIGIGVAWEDFRAKMEASQQGQGGEDRLGVVDGPRGAQNERKSRELKPKEALPPPPPVLDEDELTGLGKKKRPPPPKIYPPAEKAWRAVKADYDKLEARNDATAKKYRLRILTMEDRKDKLPEAAFVKEAAAMEEQLKSELAKPENQ